MTCEEGLFQEVLLRKGRFPVLNQRGIDACGREIKTLGIGQFLEDGWSTLKREDSVFAHVLEELIDDKSSGLPLTEREEVGRVVRYGAAMVYYPLFLQVEESDGDYVLPQVSLDLEDKLILDLEEKGNIQLFRPFLSDFDPGLLQVMGSFLLNKEIMTRSRINPANAYEIAYYTYFFLASISETEGFMATFFAAPDEGE